jgi:cellulose synthase/poly-beta-1,6-N-acetylglucosamine synthase-like glycosyltransferase
MKEAIPYPFYIQPGKQIRSNHTLVFLKSPAGNKMHYNLDMFAVSVLMPCYNAENTLGEALKSLLKQTYSDFEIIAVNDGSDDSTLPILNDWAERDTRIRVIDRPHQGIISALNAGLDDCKFQYIARMDADDLCHPERLERQVSYLENHPDIAVVGCLVRGFPPGKVRRGFQIYLSWLNSLVNDADIRCQIFVESPFAHPSVMVRKIWLDKVGGYQDIGWPEDYDLWLRLFLAGARFSKVPKFLVDWRELPQRLTRSDSRYSLENFLRLKAHYLIQGPLSTCDSVIVWGAGMTGRRLSKHLIHEGAPLSAFVDIDPRKIGSRLRKLPIISPQDLPNLLQQFSQPIVLAAVGARGARNLIRQRLNSIDLQEGKDWWGVA